MARRPSTWVAPAPRFCCCVTVAMPVGVIFQVVALLPVRVTVPVVT